MSQQEILFFEGFFFSGNLLFSVPNNIRNAVVLTCASVIVWQYHFIEFQYVWNLRHMEESNCYSVSSIILFHNFKLNTIYKNAFCKESQNLFGLFSTGLYFLQYMKVERECFCSP